MSRWTWHGGGLAAARAHFGAGKEPWLDLSTGINPQPWPGADALEIDWRRLPEEGDLRALERAAAAHFVVDPAHVCAVPGSEIGLRLMAGLVGGGASCVPGYRTHREMFSDADPVAVDRIHEADGRTLILANPNNPDGRLLGRPALRDKLARRGADGWLLVDEAFADVNPAQSMAADIGDDRRLIVFRSFGKFFGLAGLRLGFVLGPTPILARLRAQLGAWPLTAGAIAIGRAAYADQAWIAETRSRLVNEAVILDAMLRRLGFRPTGACPLFRLIEAENAHALFERLARHAILTRPFEEHPRWLRMGLPASVEDRARLEAALRDG